MGKREDKERQRGAALVLAMVLLVAFAVVLGALMQMIARQAHVTSDQAQENRSFSLADAGVRYAQWLLSAEGGWTPQDLRENPPPEAVRHEVQGAGGEVLGYFVLEFLAVAAQEPEALRFRSVGFSADKSQACQAIEGKLTTGANGEYQVVQWDHLKVFPCQDYIISGEPAKSLVIAAGGDVTVSGVLGAEGGDKMLIEMPVTPLSVRAESSDVEINVLLSKHERNMIVWLANQVVATVAGGGAIIEESGACSVPTGAAWSACLPAADRDAGKRYLLEVIRAGDASLECGGNGCEYQLTFRAS